ncbi:hypothetical protein [Treponema sp. Marseille-Q3903]|uniref:hypothetical protein n=1 Tax=Treponema sp. Marseille-Q3903 TaxID=2766703 RepID=UPI00165286F6|nr:hypothetical protein [Treponema sp. Marseille-Q3903]MBC6714269.1 hypothetical protein [Treponema sp. Marseille-Q3903]
MNNNEICIIRAKLKKDYVYDAISHYGYCIHTPYRGNRLFFRIIREIWFRANLPGKSIWFKYKKADMPFKFIILFDPLIRQDYIEWVHKKYPESKMVLSYENRADKTINPETVPLYVEKWSYDKDDCNRYGMKWSGPLFFMEYKRKRSQTPKYDVLYVGRDKGRAEKLLELEKEFNKQGLKTCFHICADRQYLRFKKRFYKPVLDYDDYLDLLVESKAILNIIPDGQTSVTQREMEAAFDGIKCITNNKGIKQFSLYDKSIFFILGEDSISNLAKFINSEIKIFDNESLAKYDFTQIIKQFIKGVC